MDMNHQAFVDNVQMLTDHLTTVIDLESDVEVDYGMLQHMLSNHIFDTSVHTRTKVDICCNFACSRFRTRRNMINSPSPKKKEITLETQWYDDQYDDNGVDVNALEMTMVT
jgi:hypothetical protein